MDKKVFAYLLATSEVNNFLTYRYSLWKEDKLPEYAVLCRNLTEQLTDNYFTLSEKSHKNRSKIRKMQHESMTATTFANNFDG